MQNINTGIGELSGCWFRIGVAPFVSVSHTLAPSIKIVEAPAEEIMIYRQCKIRKSNAC